MTSLVSSEPLLRQENGAVIVAVIAIRVMEVAIDEVVNMVAMGNSLVAAVWAVLVFRAVRVTVVAIGAVCRVGGTYAERVFVDMTVMERVQVTVVQVIGVIVVNDCSMAAILAVLVTVVLVDLVGVRH